MYPQCVETSQETGPVRRRHGAALQDALLEAAWAELRREGYQGFTIDAVARAVGTSRAVIYRRWPGRAPLVLATLRAHTGTVVGRVPDTGSLDGDVLALLHQLADRIQQIGIDVATGLFSELNEIPDEATAVVPAAFRLVIDRARGRGEVGDAPVPDAVLTMPGMLIRYSMLAERTAPSDEALDHIARQLFLPLVHHHAPR